MYEQKKYKKKFCKNKISKGFNTTDINKNFVYYMKYPERAYDAYREK